MIAYWGGHEITHRLRLRLLQEINNQWNPRFGHDHAIGSNLERRWILRRQRLARAQATDQAADLPDLPHLKPQARPGDAAKRHQ